MHDQMMMTNSVDESTVTATMDGVAIALFVQVTLEHHSQEDPDWKIVTALQNHLHQVLRHMGADAIDIKIIPKYEGES